MAVNCPECGKTLDEQTILNCFDEQILRDIIQKVLEERQREARNNKEHISDYTTFSIREEMIKAFKEYKEDDSY